MAKKKAAAKETGKASVKDQKNKVTEAKAELTAYLKENKIKRDNIPSKHKKKVDRLQKTIEKEEGILAGLNTDTKKASKAKKTGTGRKTKYEYPAGMDDPAERKKYRAKMRTAANKTEGGETKKKSKKKSSKEDSKESSKKSKSSEEKSSKKKKKSSKKKK